MNFEPYNRLIISTGYFYIEPNPSENKKPPEQLKIWKNIFNLINV